jgi:seryl-tRNA synthetase
MLDIRFIRENPELIAEKARQKGYKVDIPKLLKVDEKRRALLTEAEKVRAERNALAQSTKNTSLSFSDPKFSTRPLPADIEKGKQLKDQLSIIDDQLKPLEEEYELLLRAVPNPAFDDVPVGGEDAGVEVAKWGDQFSGGEDHLDFAIKRDWVDFERGAKVAGTKFYFLKNDLARLELALTQFGLNFLLEKGFTYMTVPHMVNTRTAAGAGFASKDSKDSNEYFIEDEDLTLIGTAEAPLTGYHADEVLEEDQLPLLYAGYSPCYRKEAGTYGKHTRGLFRVHQFNKLEMYAFTLPEQSGEVHEKLRAIEEEIWQKLGIPYHIINIASGDLGAPAAKKYDLEYWSKIDNTYRELTSCSNCTDFQARNLNIRVRRKDGSVVYVHTLNGTAISMARSLVAIIEHYQTPEGKLRIPDALQPFMNGQQSI